jgi:hypothetical protein
MNLNFKKLFPLASRIVVLAIGAALIQPAWANGNNSKDQDSATPVMVGYAVITPTSAATAGLVVFETFGEHQGNNFLQVGVLPSIMTTHAALFANADGRLSRNLGAAFANPSATPANIALTLRDETGTTVGTASFTVDAHQQTARFVTDFFANQQSVSKDFTGTLDISSNIPIAVMGLRSRGSNFSTIPATILGSVAPVPVIAANVGGPAAVILAQFAAGGGWASEIILANFGLAPLTVRVDLFASDGTPLTTTLNGQTGSSFQGITIPVGGVATLAPLNQDGDSDF